VAKSKNLELRGSTYYARITTPKTLAELRQKAGRKGSREIKRSLGTGDRRQAEVLLAGFLAQSHQVFAAEEAELRALLASGVPTKGTSKPLAVPAVDALEHAVLEFKHTELDAHGKYREAWRDSTCAPIATAVASGFESVRTPTLRAVSASQRTAFLGAVKAQPVAEREQLLKALQTELGGHNFDRVAGYIQRLAAARGWNLPVGSDQYRLFASGLLKAWVQVVDTAVRRDRGMYEDVPALPSLQRVYVAADVNQQPANDRNAVQKPKRKGEGIRDHFDAYLREQKAHVTVNAVKDHRATIRAFVELNGDRPATDYTKDHMRAFKRALKQCPKNATKLYPGKKLPEVLRLAQEDGKPKLSVSSINSKLSIMSAFGQWLEENLAGVEAENFKTSLLPRTNRQSMPPFTLEQMKAILNAYAFTGAESSRNYSRPGDFKFRDWHFWISLIAAFTGARLNEVAQLRVEDVRQEEGIWLFDITDEAENASLKTKESKRRIPVHPQLIELGLLQYRDHAVAKSWTWLFQPIKPDFNGRRSTQAGRWFRKFLARIGVKGDELGGAHRFRHTLADRLRAAGVDDYDIGLVLGHKVDVARMTSQYGRTVSMTLQRRLDVLSKATYPGVDFSLLARDTARGPTNH
jgi:integrase